MTATSHPDTGPQQPPPGVPASHPAPRTGWGVASVVLAVFAVVLLVLSSIGVWAGRTVFNTDVFVDRLGPVVEEPEVQEALGAYVAGEVVSLLDVEGLLKEYLPGPSVVLATPLTDAVDGFVTREVEAVVASERFAELWRTVLTRSHQALLGALDSDLWAATTTRDGDQITIDLVPVIATVLESLLGVSPELLGAAADAIGNLGDLSSNEVVQRIASAASITVPDDFGQLTVTDDGLLRTVLSVASAAERAVVALIVAFVVATVGAVLLAPNRRRMAFVLLGVGAVALTTLAAVAGLLTDRLTGVVTGPVARPAVSVVANALTNGLVVQLAWTLTAGILVAVALWALARKEVLRTEVASLVGTGSADGAGDGAPPGWWRPSRHALAGLGIVAAAGSVLWFTGPSAWLTGLVVAVAGIAGLLLWRASRTANPAAAPAASPT